RVGQHANSDGRGGEHASSDGRGGEHASADSPADTPEPRVVAAAGERAGSLAFRMKLLLAAGLAPQLSACASCGEREHLVGFSGAAGGVVCAACEAGSFALHEDAHAFMTLALARALADAPSARAPALAQVERAIAATLEHHAHVRLMPAAAPRG
ncbi:MAG TPA: DNA repair protein RecO C-terminal domain-containing protein, partial [Solirubrobacteraceae bacterium]|nr:DNA repair protein RecO C-terminal domain-containing protein [Solirubrobacteraceae bacterium]